MENTVLLLPHQERFLQSPRNFPDIRWHFLLAGYGAGKTRSLAIAALSLISELDGEKDDGGLYAKIAVAGYTYAHLEQTFLIDFRAYLEASKTPYHEDTKNHIVTVGTVQVILLQLSEPGRIFGQSIHAALCVDGGAFVMLERGHVPLREVTVGDMIMTKDGWHRVTAVRCSGYRPCIMTNGVYTTLNHPFIVNGGEIKMARDLTPDDMVELPNGSMLRVLQDRTLVEREVYDITVDAVHEYYAGGLRVKNCDEIDELEEDIMIEAMKSVSQRVRQIIPGHRSPYVMAASTAQGMKGFYRLYSHYKKCGVGFVLIRARTQDNWYLPREYIEDLWKNFTETERKVYMEGEFLTVSQGRVIPNFDWDRNFAPESDMDLHLLPGERVFIGQDFNQGYSRASAWVSRDGVLHCVKYYDFPDVGDAPRVFRYDFPEQDLFWVPDVTSKDQYPHFARDLRKYDVHIIHRAKSPMVEDSCFLLSKMCLQGRLMIHSQASEVADAFATASRDKNNRIPKGVGVSSPIHAIDGARYACSYMALILPEYRDIRRGLMQHLASFRRSLEEDRDEPVAKVGAGYSRIEGSAYL